MTMGLISEKGFGTEISSQSNKIYTDQDVTTSRDHQKHATELIEPSPQYPRPDDTTIAHEEANAKTYTLKTAYDHGRYPETYNTLMQYVSGTPIRVTYYRHIRSDTSIQTDYSSNIDMYEDKIHTDLEQILNFEFRTESGFNFSWNDDNKEAMFTGEGIVYPGFEVSVGDEFTYKIGDSIGLFKIDSFEPLSIRQGSYQRITFALKERLDNDGYNQLISRVCSTVVFDIQKYMSSGLTLLKTESFVQLEQLRQIRLSLIKYYSNKLYDRNINSYIRHDGVYDPYLVRYISKKISSFDTKKTAIQLVTIYDYDESLWSLFTEDRHTTLSSLKCYSSEKIKRDGVFTTLVNGVINKRYVSLEHSSTDTSDTYVLSHHFYQGDKTLMSTLEQLVYDYVTSGVVDVATTLAIVNNFRQLSVQELFYKGGIYLHLIDVAIRTIT